MASTNSSLSHMTESQFTLAPVPDMVTGDFSSGEESFVVLGHSLTDAQSLISKVPDTAPIVQNSIIDRIEENVDILLADLTTTAAECPLPAVENHFQLKNKHESFASISSELSPGEIDKKLTTILAENQQLKETILQNNLSMKSQYHKIMDWHADVEKTYKIHREKLEQAKQYITSLKDEIAILKETNLEQAKEISSIKDSEIYKKLQALHLNKDTHNVEKISELNKLLAASYSINDRLKADVLRLNSLLKSNASTSWQGQIGNMKETSQGETKKITTMKDIEKETHSDEEISELNKLLAASRAENEKFKADILRLNSLLQASTLNTSVDKKSMSDSQKYKNDQIETLQDEIKTLRHQLMVSQQAIMETGCARQMLNATLASKEKEICKLADLLKNFKYTEDDMFALKTQLDVYKADFETERKAKESITASNNQIAEDLQQVHARNRELQEEVELLRSHTDYSYIQREGSSSRARTLQTSQKFECPKCQFVFTTFGALENHVHRCLDLEGTLP